MSKPISIYGQTIRQWRLYHGYRSRSKFAAACGVSVYTIQGLELGNTRTPSDLFRAAILRFAAEQGWDPPAGWTDSL